MTTTTETTRERIVRAAAELLAHDGREAVSTRAVATAAGTQPPTIYRLFGDKQGLLDAVAEHGFARYVESKDASRPTGDPVQWLRDGWDEHVAFGLAQPALYRLVYGESRPGGSPVRRRTRELLARRIDAVAAAGRLTASPARATDLFDAGGVGVVLSLLDAPDDDRDTALSQTMRETLIAAVTAEPPQLGSGDAAAAHAVALAHELAGQPALVDAMTGAERALLTQWLSAIADRR